MDASALAAAIADPRAAGIAASVARLITSGDLVQGDRLPTVRALARELGVSPTTVSEAWSTLASVGSIETHGRAGTLVRAPGGDGTPGRSGKVTQGSGQFALDLSTGIPDPALLPDLSAALAEIAQRARTTSYLDDHVLPDLGATLRSQWPFEPAELAIVDGAQDALDRLITVAVPFGSRVLVENPAFPPLLDRLELAGAEVIPLTLDESGVTPDSLAEGLSDDPVAVFLQPRAHNPTGISMTTARAEALGALLAPTDALVIEDDYAGAIATAPAVSLGQHLPERTVRVLSFSKSYGPDLRLAAVGGGAGPIARLLARRRLGAGWSSRLLQATLYELMTDATTQSRIAAAREEYARRRARLVDALDTHGLQIAGDDGLNIWVPVADEQGALVSLAARGVGAAPGRPFCTGPLPPHIRITAGLVPADNRTLPEQIVRAASASTVPPA